MKKKLLPIFIFPLVVSIASCGGKEESKSASDDTTSEATSDDTSSETTIEGSASEGTIDNQEAVDNLKSLLAKQDLSPFTEKSFFTIFQQNFSVYSNSINDNGKSIEFFNYNGSGSTGYYYNADAESYEEVIKNKDYNTFDIMCQGLGYYSLVQYATINSFLNDNFDEEEIQKNNRYTYMQQVQALFDDLNLQIENWYLFSDFNDDDNKDMRLFNGIISKDILFGSYTTKALTDIFDRINIYDGPGYAEAIDALYYQICLSLLECSDEEISEFIINNNIEYAESNYYFDLSFELKEEKYIEYLSENDVIPGIIKGTLHLDKETKELDSFEYRLFDFEEEADYSTNYVHTASMEFIGEGYSRHGKPEGEISMSEDPTEFTDPKEFIEQVIDQVIPAIAK